jgi:hypothetical protein
MRLEALMELRDEAAYLQLEGLRKLCIDEIRHRQSPKLHARGLSSCTIASNHSMNASVSSLHTLLEKGEADFRHEARRSKDSDSRSLKDASRLIPTPQSWKDPTGERTHKRPSLGPPMRSAPAGWI